jgi:4-hydroxybenzoate polyprenyltransferase
MKLPTFVFFLLIISIIGFVLIYSFTDEHYEGREGSGYGVGFVVKTKAIVGSVLLLMSIVAYWVITKRRRD